ncbi:hypothetical protein WICPIJ_001745 [Wickerhamomyces pijperi]|uniref:Proline-rich protein HUA1 n=1 Tax=Wickerhamomyces pijperi TaxID=599730 RepID=A0A9P8QB24_WICPI|nr:hypothetical protein WICPIJ_001745 [Wickerhamomyces pijperi]
MSHQSNDLPPPSYEEAVNEPFATSSSTSFTTSTSTTSRFSVSSDNPNDRKRPPPPPRPAPAPQQQSSYQESQPMWSSRPPEPTPYNQQSSNLPWRYPARYFCNKCKNTGYKFKDGQRTNKSCKDCWSKFAKNNAVFTQNTTTTASNYQPMPQFMPMPIPMPMPMQPMPMPMPQPMMQLPPRVVRPGDPSIGGVLCGVCRGSGRIYGLFDDSLCQNCFGVGRILR